VKRSGLVVHILFLLVLAVLGQAFAEPPKPQPIDHTQLMAWITGGISNARLSRLVFERGVAFTLSATDEKQLRAAGADGQLVKALRASHRSASSKSLPYPPALTKAAELAHQKMYEAAADQLTALLHSDPDNASLHFALGQMLLRQEQWDNALEEFTESARLMPSFPESHNRLAYIFSRSENAESAIAEARTALSMDPGNAEAYRQLGLGLYGTGKNDAALHAYEESLGREPENADVYYDIGIVRRDMGDLRGAVVAYRHVLRINPDFWEAHSNLGVVFHDLGKLDEAVAEYREAKRLAPGNPRSAIIWETRIATSATTMLRSPNFANWTTWMQDGKADTPVWPRPSW